jgi:molybdopterin-containing oxidoreductase family membrane subunit
MSEAQSVGPERLRVGKLSRRWVITVTAFALLAGWGVYAYSHEFSHGLITSGLRTIGQGGASWGLYIIFAVYFIGLSFGGISIAAIARLFSLEELWPLARPAMLLTIVFLLMGALCVVADLGRPIQGLLFLPRYARPFSPLYGTFTLVVAGYLFASLVSFYLTGRADAARCAEYFPKFRWAYKIWASGFQGNAAERRRHGRATFWLSLCILPLLITATSTLGLVFGIQSGRPGWYSALQAPGFVVVAAASGTAMLIIISAVIRKLMSLEDVISDDAFKRLGNFLWVLLSVYLYFMLIEEVTASYAGGAAELRVAHEVVFGHYAGMFWATVACFVVATNILFMQFVWRRTHDGWMVVASVLVNVGAILRRFLIVIPSQTHGMHLPYPPGSYTPSWAEISVVLGMFATAGLLYLLFIKAFPIIPTVAEEVYAPFERGAFLEPKRIRVLRRVFFWATLSAGVVLAVVGFLLSLRVGTLPYLDPVVPYSPVVFILGVMVSFGSAAVYETLPAPRENV